MSKIKDYLKIVKEGLKNGDKIIEAHWIAAQVKNGTISPEALAEIFRRKDICAGCEHNSINAKLKGYVDPVPLHNIPHCIQCWCLIGGEDTKEYCLSCNCGITELNKRNAEKGISSIPLKWEAFDIKNKQDE